MLASCAPKTETGAGGGGATAGVSDLPPAFGVNVIVLDEEGEPVPGAAYAVEPGADSSAPRLEGSAAEDGTFRLEGLRDPVLLTLEAPGFISEPLVVDREDSETGIRVRLLGRKGASGQRRIVLHFAGDTMLGRRFLEPASECTATVVVGDGGDSARQVVAAVAPLFRAADVRSLNLETVLGVLPPSEAYPAKRFLLQSPPETLGLLEELGANLVALGNNHVRDWLDIGTLSTIDLLGGGGFRHAGAGSSEAAARIPWTLEVEGHLIGCLSYTTVDGDPVNDALPDDAAPRPASLRPEDAWMYEPRLFGYRSATVDIPEACRRPGGFWRVFKEAESGSATATEIAELWSRAFEVYPELQDWTARRGHGGANPYAKLRMVDDIRSLRAQGCVLVVVQIHAGYQFLEAKSKTVEAAAHAAIDAGADLVVCHHPHVLQGFEWYQGKVVAYSLGNFVFDQDFLATFATAVLRAVFEETAGGRLAFLEARVYPVEIDAYRPVPLAGKAARRLIRDLAERSALPLRSENISGAARNVLRDPAAEATPVRLLFERGTARIGRWPAPAETRAMMLDGDAIVELDPPSLTRSRASDGSPLEGVLFGRDLFGWGDFEDRSADDVSRGGTHWDASKSYKRVEVSPDCPEGIRRLAIRRTSANDTRALARPVARIPLARHRMYRDSGGILEPADGEPRYEIALAAKFVGGGAPLVRLVFYRFDDSNPTEDPISEVVAAREVPLAVPADGAWHEVRIPIAEGDLLGGGGAEANALLLYIGLAPPPEGTSYLYADRVRVFEWRRSEDLPDGFFAFDALRAEPGTGPIEVEVERTAD
ncbi:MAG: CapA family protein [Planctomycetota bacterium]